MMHRLIVIARRAGEYRPDILSEAPIIYSDKVRLVFIDGSYMDIRYPLDTKYSFHWQRKNEIFRVDTAPHHRELSTYPRHMHMGKEECVIGDTVTRINNTIEENVRCMLEFAHKKLKNS